MKQNKSKQSNIIKHIKTYFSIRKQDVIDLIDKLPKLYHTIDIPIIIIPHNFMGFLIHLYYEWKYDIPFESKQEFDISVGTSYYRNKDRKPVIIIIHYNSQFPLVLFHEIRHWYQQKYKASFHAKCHTDIDINDKLYSQQVLEQDANKFAMKHCKKMGLHVSYCTKYKTIRINWYKSKISS